MDDRGGAGAPTPWVVGSLTKFRERIGSIPPFLHRVPRFQKCPAGVGAAFRLRNFDHFFSSGAKIFLRFFALSQ
jgi:hypothetical protein